MEKVGVYFNPLYLKLDFRVYFLRNPKTCLVGQIDKLSRMTHWQYIEWPPWENSPVLNYDVITQQAS